MMTLPAALAQTLQELVERRYIGNDEEASGWRNVFQIIDGDDKGDGLECSYIIATRDVRAFQVRRIVRLRPQ